MAGNNDINTTNSYRMESATGEFFLDCVVPEFVGENIHYTVFDTDYDCEFIVSSRTPLDSGQISIECGDEVLYSMSRKDGASVEGAAKNIEIRRMSYDRYMLTFDIDNAYPAEKLNRDQVKVTVWNLASSSASHTTGKTWYKLDYDSDNYEMKPLKVEVVSVSPADMIVIGNTEAEILVKVSNPNVSLRPLMPTVELSPGSVGTIKKSTMTYNEETGVLMFYISSVNRNGHATVNAWITVDNDELYELIKKETMASTTVGPFLYTEEGRKYRFDSYVPKYLADEDYAAFVKFFETCLNTSHVTLDTGARISALEKIARIGDFHSPDKAEPSLMNIIREEFNFEITPNLDEYITYMYGTPVDGGDNGDDT